MPETVADLVALFHAHGRGRLATLVKDRLRPVRMRAGLIEIGHASRLARDDIREIQRLLREWTGERWQVVISSDEEGAPSLREKEEAERRVWQERAMADPVVRALFAAFPQARLVSVRRRENSTSRQNGKDAQP
ncbi:MAG: hypothetical protein D6740_12370 [Alphaproteobacteria bacterium]|nr:MAG: hypothetical protein D6740_12370 [Alphaproteobacteria bacterium]